MRHVPWLVALLLATAAAPAGAATEAADQQGLGAYVSNIAGSGLSYQRHMPSGWGWRVAGFGRVDEGSNFLNAGFALTKDIDHRPWGTLYALGAVGVGLSSFLGGNGLSAATNVQANLSPGLGFTWGPFTAELAYSLYYNDGKLGLVPAGGAGLVWWF